MDGENRRAPRRRNAQHERNGGAILRVADDQILQAFDHVTVVRDLENQSSYRRNADFYLVHGREAEDGSWFVVY